MAPGVDLSVIMPVYNEARTIAQTVERVRRAPVDLSRELVVVDDASTDGTGDALAKIVASRGDDIRVLTHPVNRGKGAAIRTGIGGRRGRIVLIQDADLEYDPRDFPRLLAADPRRRGRRRVRLALPRRAAPRALLLALAGQPRSSRCCRTCSPT